MDLLIFEYVNEIFALENQFSLKFGNHVVQEDCLLQIRKHLKGFEEKLRKKTLRKLRNQP